jgi:hypothetical protein
MARPGAYEQCPVCRSALWSPPTVPLGERGCPRCGAKLWVLGFASGPEFFVRRPGEAPAELIAALAGPQLGLTAAEIGAILAGADDLDLIEFLTDVEDAVWSRRGRADRGGPAAVPP